MIGLAQARKLARFRGSERRAAAASLMVATEGVVAAEARIDHLDQLSQTVAVGAGQTTGKVLAAGGEFVARLSAGRIATVHQRDRQVAAAENARLSFGLADARAQIAGRNLSEAERSDAKIAEHRAALKTPFRGIGSCR